MASSKRTSQTSIAPVTRRLVKILYVYILIVVVSDCHSEAFATSFFPASTRGGASLVVPELLSNPIDGETEQPKANGHQQPSEPNGISLDVGDINALNGANGDVELFSETDELRTAAFIAETKLPTDIGHFRMRAYRTSKSAAFVGTEPCVIYYADKPPFGERGTPRENVNVRVHDQCLTSEVFRSKRCDCKDQLKMGLEYIKEHGGFIIYLQQEGRGIGLANKVAAYALQDVGMDTVDANLHLGFPEDARQYGVIPSILDDMGIASINLMTNNPRKIRRLTELGVKVTGNTPMVIAKANEFNKRYLETKKARMNHKNFGDMLLASADIEVAPTKFAEDFITEGQNMAASAVQISLEGSVADNAEDTEDMEGVVARDDGYCFGRKSVEDAIEAMAAGEMIVVVDDMSRENEGDLIIASDLCTPEAMAKIVRYSSGVICVAMEGKRMDELKLPAMVSNNEDPKETAFAVSVDAVKEKGITTGISATDRSTTVQILADPNTKHTDLARPGHIFPLRAREGGVLTRDGHTEASIDFPRLAGLNPCGVLCEIVSEEDPIGMMRLPELRRFAKREGLVLTSIADLQQYRRDTGQ